MHKHKFFLIHNYKTLGTTIYSQLPKTYTDVFYGSKTLLDIETTNPSIQINPDYDKTKQVSIDHYHVDKLVDIGLLSSKEIRNLKFMMIVRDPLERFISICNYQNISPKVLISNLKQKKGDDFFQHKLIKSKFNFDVVLYKMKNKRGIIDFFKSHDIDLNLEKKLNVSEKHFSIKDMTTEDIEFVKNFYQEDYNLFDMAL